MKNIKEKPHRLQRHHYIGQLRITFTLCLSERKKLFTSEKTIHTFLGMLKRALPKYNCKNWMYVFMPDHLHLILEGCSSTSDLWKTIVWFKQLSGYWLSKNKSGIRWQKDFYDHIHRKEENLKTHIKYLLENPIRKGICTDWRNYPFKGSLDYDLNEIIT